MTEPEVRQRLAAILAADVAGYSRLMGDDERATIATLNQFRAIFREHIEANQGRVVDMAGDSVLAIFETAAGAVLTGVAVQTALAEKNEELAADRRMVFRIGVHLGDIHQQDDGTIYGDGVNVAARLESLAEPGGICVSDMARGAVKGHLDLDFADLGEQTVKNIAEPVRAYRILAKGEVAPAGARKRTPIYLVAAAVVVLAIVGVGWWQFGGAPEPEVVELAPGELPPVPSGPAIAVLPFDNLSGDREQEYFADGLAEDILTRLAAFLDLKVIARNSSFQYKGTAVDVREVGRELGADYVLEGSVRRDATSIRISAQLLDARDGSHVWAETYDRDLSVASVFAIQDEITEHVTAAIGGAHGAIAASGIGRLGRALVGDLRSYECVLLAYQFSGLPTPEVHKAARDCLEEVVVREPNYIEALAWLGQIYLEEIWSGFNPRDTGPTSLEAAFEVLARAKQLDPNHQQVRRALAWAYLFDRDKEQLFDEARKAIETNPNDVETLALMGQAIGYAGRWDECKALTERLRNLTDNLPIWHHYTEFNYHYRDKDFVAAAASARASQGIEHWGAPWYLALAYAGMGENDKAMEAFAKARALEPNLTTDFVREARGTLFLDEAHLALLMDGHAGLLEIEQSRAPSRPVIAVLPFDNMSDDPEQEYFADGITEDIITRLARFSDIGVIARNSSFQYKGKNVDIRTVADALGATYVLEGSVRRSENEIRVTAQLLDPSDGTHLWAETWDRSLAVGNIFAIQDEITSAVAGVIAGAHGVIARVEVEDILRRDVGSLEAYECVLLTQAYERSANQDSWNRAYGCLANVLDNEPDQAEALAAFAFLSSDSYAGFFGDETQRDKHGRDSDRAIKEALKLAPGNPKIQWMAMYVKFVLGDIEGFRMHADRARALNPNDPDIKGYAGALLALSGSYDQGLAYLDEAMGLNPDYPEWWLNGTAIARWMTGDREGALAALIKQQHTDNHFTYILRASVLSDLGRWPEAQTAIGELRRLRPGFDLADLREEMQFWNYERPLRQRIEQSLGKVGFSGDMR